jgi:O-antigen/teichoic acid export membrane protein
MAFIVRSRGRRNRHSDRLFAATKKRPRDGRSFPTRIASNFAILGVAEVVCRAISVLVTLALAKRLGTEGFGRIEFGFNVVFWLVLIVRDCFETIATREISRHPRLTRSLVNHILAVKLAIAIAILGGLAIVNALVFSSDVDRGVLSLYALLVLTTALGLDFVFRGNERIGLVACSLLVRTLVYFTAVWFLVTEPGRILLVPLGLALGELTGIALVWLAYARRFGFPRPVLRIRFLLVFLRRGRSIGLIHLFQAIMVSADLLVVWLMSPWSDVGRYGAPHRMISAVMAFGIIFQQVVFPSLSRIGRTSTEAGKRLLDFAVRVLVTGFLPVAVGGALLADPLVRFLLPPEYHGSALLLGLGIWRAPLLSLAFLYQASLIAMNRETAGLRLLGFGAIASAPLIAVLQWRLGLPGASMAVPLIGLGLVVAGYCRLVGEGRAPAAHHHLAYPAIACIAMCPVCLVAARVHVTVAVLAGALAYTATLKAIGGLEFRPAELAESRGLRAGTAAIDAGQPGRAASSDGRSGW